MLYNFGILTHEKKEKRKKPKSISTVIIKNAKYVLTLKQITLLMMHYYHFFNNSNTFLC